MDETNTERRAVLRSAGVVSASTLASRVLGMARDVAFAAVFGAGAVFDSFVVAFRIPNLFRHLFGEGALSNAFIPVFSGEERAGGRAAAFAFFQRVLTLLSLLLAVVTVLGTAAALLLPPEWFGAGDARAKAELTLRLTALLFPHVFLINVMALFMAVLNTLGHFFAPAIAPAVLNVFWLGGILAAPHVAATPESRMVVVCVAILAGGIVQTLMQVPYLRARGVPLAPRGGLGAPPVRRMLALLIPMVLGLAPVQVNIFLDSLIAEICVPGDGANSFLFYGNRLMQFPLALIGIALGVVVFPVFARQAKAGDRAALGKTLSDALGTTFFLATPAGAGLVALCVPATALIYEWGKFGAADTASTAFVLAMYSLGVPAFCGLQILTRLFYSLEDPMTPVRVGAFMVLLNLALNLTLVWFLGAGGLALATTLSALANLLVLATIARRRHRIRGLRGVLGGIARSFALSAAMGGAVFGLYLACRAAFPVRTLLLHKALWVLPPLVAGIALYAGLAILFRFPEARALLPRLRGR